LGGCTPSAARWTGSTGITFDCNPLPDSDVDGLGDACELGLARAFAPALRVSQHACNWDTSVEPARLGGEYYFGAQPNAANGVRLVYLPAYYRDCGWTGVKCTLPIMSCAGHSGDSEFIAIDIERSSPDLWRTVAVFLSAHCFDRSTANCRWYRDGDLAQFSWTDQQRSAPVIWVAEGKNAHYASRQACNRGHWFYDTCDNNENSLRYPIAAARQNIGSRAQPSGDAQGCLGARYAGWLSRQVDEQARECFWADSVPFTGWQRPAAGGATSYARYLREIARFW
jgi:hypothetical protein